MKMNILNETHFDKLTILFGSPNALGDVGYKIEIQGDEIISEQEISLQDPRKEAAQAAAGSGEEGVLSEDVSLFYPRCGGIILEIIPLEEAIANMHSIFGYENEIVTEVEAICGPGGLTWYWGLRTSKGSVTVKANK